MANSDYPEQEARILITGANGFVGRHLIAQLCADRQSSSSRQDDQSRTDRTSGGRERLHIFAGVRVSDGIQNSSLSDGDFNRAGWAGGTVQDQVEIVSIELENSVDLTQKIARIHPHYIYHLAARSSGAAIDREAIYAANVVGTRNLLEAASQLSPFPQVLLASTGYVYGNTDPRRPAREEDPIGPLWKYGAYTDSKIEMESAARAYRAFAVSVRAFAHTGPGQTPTFALPGFARQIVRMERGQEACELRVGNLDAVRDILDVRDVVRAYTAIMTQTDWHSLAGNAVNVATGQPVQMRDVVQRLCDLSSVSPKISVDPARLRALDIACSTGDPTRLHMLTRRQPQRLLDTTLEDLLEYWREQSAP